EVLDDAEILLAAALEMAPDYIELRRDYACVLLDRHKHAEAIEQLDRLLKLDPKNIDYRTLHATATVGLGDHEGGIRGFAAVLAARQGARGPRRVRGVVALLRARQCAQARRESLPRGAGGTEHRTPEAGVHTRVFLRARRLRRRKPRTDLYSRAAACGLDAARADT